MIALDSTPAIYAIIAGTALSVAVGSLLWWLSGTFGFGRRVALSVGFLGFIAAAAYDVLFISTPKPTNAEVAIHLPASNTTISGPRLHIEGTVVPSDARVTAIVKSEYDVYWWVQPLTRPGQLGSGPGTWSMDVSLGTPTEGTAINYQIVALASVDSIPLELLGGRFLHEGMRLRSPPSWSQSAAITVRRLE